MNTRKSLGLVAAIAALAIVYLAWSFFKPAEEASGPIEAEPVALQQPAEAPAEQASDAPAYPGQSEDASVEDASAEDGDAAGGEAADPAAAPTIFEIQPGASVARFEIDEVLRGEPTHVVGTTDQVAGQIALDPAHTASVEIGEILVNVRTLATDSEFRDRAIKNKILLTNQYEFVRFTPTGVTGLPASLSEGESASFQMTGDIEIAGNVHPITFEGSVTLAGPSRLEGSASTTIPYADFGIIIPAARSVDAVEDTLILALDFVAEAQ